MKGRKFRKGVEVNEEVSFEQEMSRGEFVCVDKGRC